MFMFGLFQTEATGTVGIGAAVLFFALFSLGRWWALWSSSLPPGTVNRIRDGRAEAEAALARWAA